MRKASLSSRLRFFRRASPLAARAFAAGTAFWILLLAAVHLPWAQTARNFQERRAERAALAPILAEARRADLSFPQVVVAHPAHVGKPVYWNVTVATPTFSYAEGRPAWAIVWTNPDRVIADISFNRNTVLARVAAVDADAVYLDYLGRP